MTKKEWESEIRKRLITETGSDVCVARATDLMRILNYKDAKHFKKSFLAGLTPCCGKQYSVKDFLDVNYGRTLL